MKSRYMVLGLSVVLALALAVPALGGPTNPVASVSVSIKSVANKALKKAKAAQATANGAAAAAANAQNSANSAGNTANEAKKKAEGAQTTANEAKKKAETAQGTANEALTKANSAQATANSALASANSRMRVTGFTSGTATPEDTTKSKIAAVECAANQQVTGGSAVVIGERNKVTVTSGGSAFYGPGWLVTAEAITGQTPTWALQAVAVCASP